MAWKVEFSASAGKEFDRLDKPIKARIRAFIKEKIEPNPRAHGAPMSGDMAGCWKYRIGDYRLVADIEDGILVVLILRARHRKDVYRKR